MLPHCPYPSYKLCHIPTFWWPIFVAWEKKSYALGTISGYGDIFKYEKVYCVSMNVRYRQHSI